MILSRKFLNKWIDLSKISDQEIATALNNRGFEVEKTYNLAKSNTNLITGQIIQIKQHPQLTKLNICDVSIGQSQLTIICGASNIAVGMKVIVAQIGSVLTSGFIIKPRNFHDVYSQGMLCSLAEIGLNPAVLTETEQEGIAVLPDHAVLGDSNPLLYLGLDDTIFDIQLTINRSDCLSMYALAREIASYFNLAIAKITVDKQSAINRETKKVTVNTPDIQALAYLQIELAKEQLPLKTNQEILRLLQLADIKPENYWKDIANYVMLEIGQPLLVIEVQTDENTHFVFANNKEELKTENSTVLTNDLVIKNNETIIENIGINTNEENLVNNNSTEIALFSLNITNYVISDQFLRHGKTTNLLRTRLTKPVPPDCYFFALWRLLSLLKTEEVNFKIVNFTNEVPLIEEKNNLLIDWKLINNLLGTNYSCEEIIQTLTKIDCFAEKSNDEDSILVVSPVFHRSDLKLTADFAEEILRIKGYDSIELVKPKLVVTDKKNNSLSLLLDRLRQYLMTFGFNHVKTYSLTSSINNEKFNFFNFQKPISLLTPISNERAEMRFSLVESLLSIASYNNNHKQEKLAFMTDEVIYSNDQKKHNHYLTFLVADCVLKKWTTDNNYQQNHFFVIKGWFESFLKNELKIDLNKKITYQENQSPSLNPYLSFDINYEGQHLATIGCLHPNLLKTYGLSETIYFCETNCFFLNKINNQQQKLVPVFKNWIKFNVLNRDLSFIIENQITYQNITEAITNLNLNNLVSYKLIDLYLDENLEKEASKAFTFNLTFNSPSEQLDETKITTEINKIKDMLTTQFNAKIR